MQNFFNVQGTVLLKDLRKTETYAQIWSLNKIGKKPSIKSNRTLDFKPPSYAIELCFLLFWHDHWFEMY